MSSYTLATASSLFLNPPVYQMCPLLDDWAVPVFPTGEIYLILLIREESPRVSTHGRLGLLHIWSRLAHPPLQAQLRVHSLSRSILWRPTHLLCSVRVRLPNQPLGPRFLLISGAPLSTNPLIFSSAASVVLFDIFLPQTKVKPAYVSLDLRLASYIHTNVKFVRPQRLPMASLSSHMKVVSLPHLFSRWEFQEILSSSLTPRIYIHYQTAIPLYSEGGYCLCLVVISIMVSRNASLIMIITSSE